MFNKIGKRDLVFNVQSSGRIKCKDYCPVCNNGPLDGSTCIESTEKGNEYLFNEKIILPKAGDISICSRCGESLTYFQQNEELKIRKITKEEIEEFKKSVRPEEFDIFSKTQEFLKNKFQKSL